jgi:FkbM family methyltransferase
VTYEYRNFRGKDWLWPKSDYHCWKHLTEYFPDIPEQILFTIDGANTVVQAGGNCGLYTAQYADMVDKVITFEPEPTNYHCLKENLKEYNNVTIYPHALGNVEKLIGMRKRFTNMGASFVSKSLKGNIKQVPLDNFDIQPDLIHLDIEGMEKSALRGAMKILKKYHPAVVIERNVGANLLVELGYEPQGKFGLDYLHT